ncbi:hypothetical protein K435DRAFT_853295 [Dendrothele bispora CBS 962.96]|uniref:Uncharacterized protein n=1 Tax=Dendrothele bispora (strain CBS 962.96) TaxID=1314807 RepID=A0A4S8MI54_DENBC|nr:hypothetical protein K435DRAFT_853295 [Dendrothele bispora CBS 962.96]
MFKILILSRSYTGHLQFISLSKVRRILKLMRTTPAHPNRSSAFDAIFVLEVNNMITPGWVNANITNNFQGQATFDRLSPVVVDHSFLTLTERYSQQHHPWLRVLSLECVYHQDVFSTVHIVQPAQLSFDQYASTWQTSMIEMSLEKYSNCRDRSILKSNDHELQSSGGNVGSLYDNMDQELRLTYEQLVTQDLLHQFTAWTWNS